ncbi:hypothetical protein PPL_10974 [Heterostelium album PN500]|uniref:Uncharacterized protein n=1 Tax=Heterostelium pallidum (strain ATCC 26659 / Pp 5 / PN500) TaxID=670386 RepID=D3BSK5_HETP5|nr:hypothetical protein PPL_10974 [Heterostelium album PN500]EFA75470.1 hypothetical protein PPL_10974 [Heterostelium album PN500]|eukprot:XP_020427604.1 hypothetical protein PPL_10974 [Heterostelium album PN500]
MSYLIPSGFVGRTTKSDVRLYCDNVTLDSSVFVIKTTAASSSSFSLISIMHLDLHSGELVTDLLMNEIKYHRQQLEQQQQQQQQQQDIKTTVWRCHNIPLTTEPKYKQAEANAEIDQIWQEVLELPSTMNVECRAINVHETASMTLLEAEPQLFKVNELITTPIDSSLLRAISLINEIVSLDSIINNNTEPTTSSTITESSSSTESSTTSSSTEEKTLKGSVIFNDNEWNQSVIEQLLKLDDKALPLVEVDPYLFQKYIDKLNLPLNDQTAVVNQLFDAINRYRASKGLDVMKQQKVGPNDSCLCKSGQKFKKCHGGGTGSTSKFFLLYPSTLTATTTSSSSSTNNKSNNNNNKKKKR